MLVLARLVGEQILIGSDIVLTVTQIRGGEVRLGIEAPRETKVLRAELSKLKPKEKNDKAN